MTETEFIDNLKSAYKSTSHSQIKLGIGDDAGILRLSCGGDILVAKDILTEGVDFVFPETSPFTVGRKALAVNLSDMAAMACKPVAALVGLVLPHTDGAEIAAGIMDGINALAHAWSIGILGGDTNSWSQAKGTIISITIIGEPLPGVSPVTRGGAKPGDAVMVTGTLGGSIHGKQFHFTPRLREAEQLARTSRITSMIDLSDGLAKDVSHIAAASGVAIIIEKDALPLAAAAAGHWQRALTDGEDFELCFTCAQYDAARLTADQPLAPVPLTRIGSVRSLSDIASLDVESSAARGLPGVFLRDRDGKVSPLSLRGFEHRLDKTFPKY